MKLSKTSAIIIWTMMELPYCFPESVHESGTEQQQLLRGSSNEGELSLFLKNWSVTTGTTFPFFPKWDVFSIACVLFCSTVKERKKVSDNCRILFPVFWLPRRPGCSVNQLSMHWIQGSRAETAAGILLLRYVMTPATKLESRILSATGCRHLSTDIVSVAPV